MFYFTHDDIEKKETVSAMNNLLTYKKTRKGHNLYTTYYIYVIIIYIIYDK